MKYKIGQKVKVVGGAGHEFPIGEIVIITNIDDIDDFPYGCKCLDGNDYWWCAESDLAPLEKTLETLERGDVVVSNGYKRKILAVIPGTVPLYAMSAAYDFDSFSNFNTFKELKDDGYKILTETPESPETISIAGHNYSKSEVEKRLEGLEEVK